MRVASESRLEWARREIASHLHRFEGRYNVQHSQLRAVPACERYLIGERADGGLAEVHRTDDLFEFDHDALRC